MNPQRLASVLTAAFGIRPDVAKATVLVAEDNPGLLIIDVRFHTGRRKRIEASVVKLLDGRTAGRISIDLLGPLSPEARKGSPKWNRQFERFSNTTPADLARQAAPLPESPPARKHDPFRIEPAGDEASGVRPVNPDPEYRPSEDI